MKFKLLITCCCAVVCFYSNAMQPIRLQEFHEGKGKQMVLHPEKKRSLDEHCLSPRQKRICTREKDKIFDKKIITIEQLLSLGNNEISSSNISLNHDGKDVIEARCLFLASIRNIVILRHQFRNCIYVEKCQQEELRTLKNREKELEKNIEKFEKREKELEKNMEINKKEATDRYMLLKIAQSKQKVLPSAKKHSLDEHSLPQQQKRICTEKKEGIFDKEIIAVEQLLSLGSNEISSSNISLSHDGKDVIKARCLFLVSIRNIVILRHQLRNCIYIGKCQQEELRTLKNREKELEKNIEKFVQKEKELEKNIETNKKEAADKYMRLKIIQNRAKL